MARRIFKTRGNKARFQDTDTGRILPWETMNDGVTELSNRVAEAGMIEDNSGAKAHAALMKLTKQDLIDRIGTLPDNAGITNVSKVRKDQLATILVARGIDH